MKLFKLSDLQATAILEMRLQTLAALERKKIETELKEKHALIEELESDIKEPGAHFENHQRRSGRAQRKIWRRASHARWSPARWNA